MNLVRKRFKTDCGVASLAMLANIKYAKALKSILPRRKKFDDYAVTSNDIERAIKKLKLRIKKRTKVKSFLDCNTCLIIIKSSEKFNHALIWDADSKMFFDPEGTEPIDNTWTVIKNNHRHKPHFYYRKNILYYYELV